MSDISESQDESVENECPELSVGENIGWLTNIRNAFPAFKSRNYQLYFYGQLISLVGTWLQIVAEGWLVWQLTHSAFFVGLDAAAATIPSLFLSLIGGVLVDRYPKKIIIMWTQTASMMLAFTLGILAVTHTVTVWEIIVLAFGLGIVNAIDSPARQSYVIELVGEKESLASAIALNSGMYNAARVIGPSIAGLLIAAVGTGMAFILNGVSYIAVIIALYFIITPLTAPHVSVHPVAAIKDGLRYTYHHTVIRTLIILAGVVSIFGWSYSTLMPVIATQIFHFTAAGLGYLYSAAGLGALTATILISAFSHKMNRMTIIASGTVLFSTALILFTFVSNIPIAFILLFAIGIGLVSQFSMINTVIQHEVEDAMRGRVMSVYTLVFIGLSPFGSLGIGLAAEYIGSQWAMRLSATVVLFVGIYLIINRHHFIQNKLPTEASSDK